MVLFYLFLLYIIVGSVITVLTTYADDVIFDADLSPVFVLFWPIYTLPRLLVVLLKKVIDCIKEWL